MGSPPPSLAVSCSLAVKIAIAFAIHSVDRCSLV